MEGNKTAGWKGDQSVSNKLNLSTFQTFLASLLVFSDRDVIGEGAGPPLPRIWKIVTFCVSDYTIVILLQFAPPMKSVKMLPPPLKNWNESLFSELSI